MCGVGISNCELSRTSASSLRLGSPVACVGFRQHTGTFPPGYPSSIAGSLGTWSWQPGHRIVVQHWSSMPAATSGMAVPLCRACDRLGGVSFLLEHAKCTVINPCVSLPLYLLDKIYMSLIPQCVKSLSLSNSQVCEALWLSSFRLLNLTSIRLVKNTQGENNHPVQFVSSNKFKLTFAICHTHG